MYGALYGIIRNIILGEETNEAIRNKTLIFTQEAGKVVNSFFLILHKNYLLI